MTDNKSNKKDAKGTQVQGKSKKGGDGTERLGLTKEKKERKKAVGIKSAPCPWLCDLVPANVPGPGTAQTVLHPRKDVFVLKVAKVGATGDRRCKMELELVTPKGPEKKILSRVDTRETQCDPDPLPCCCVKPKKKKK